MSGPVGTMPLYDKLRLQAGQRALVMNAPESFYSELGDALNGITMLSEPERELDFACSSFQSPQAIEVKYVTELDWQDKRLKGVKLFLRRYPQTKKVIIITKNVDKKITDDKVTISMVPAWKYLIQDPSPSE